MSNIVRHRFQSAKSDGTDQTQVQPSQWNDGHLLTGGNNNEILARDTTDTFGAKWITLGLWIPYTPTWQTFSGPAPVLGNGTLTGRFTVIGHTVHFTIQFATGSTTNIGTGIWAFSLPPGNAPNGGHMGGTGWIVNGANGSPFHGVLTNAGTFLGLTNMVTVLIANGGTAQSSFITAGMPIPWATGSYLFITGMYET